MAKVQIEPLPTTLRSYLRTGVAITSLTQCVEELVLNAVDAGASCIAVRVDLSYLKVQVVDNGDGIPHDQLDRLGNRFCTSKCHTIADINNLCHYGYRGEALASIVDCCGTFEVVTRSKADGKTYTKIFKNGKEAKIFQSTNIRPSVGSTMTVQQLFSNFPVRQKSMNQSLELGRLRETLEGIALIKSGISFSLRNDATGQVIMSSKKCPNICRTFSQLYGSTKADALVEVSGTTKIFSIHGYIGKEGHQRKNLQFVYVNGRLVKNSKIHKLLKKILLNLPALKPKMRPISKSPNQPLFSTPPKFSEAYPVYVLEVKCPIQEYDITFEPAKTMVEFKDWDTLLSCVSDVAESFVKSENLSLHISRSPVTTSKPASTEAEQNEDDQVIAADNLTDVLVSKAAKRVSKECDVGVTESSPTLETPATDTERQDGFKTPPNGNTVICQAAVGLGKRGVETDNTDDDDTPVLDESCATSSDDSSMNSTSVKHADLNTETAGDMSDRNEETDAGFVNIGNVNQPKQSNSNYQCSLSRYRESVSKSDCRSHCVSVDESLEKLHKIFPSSERLQPNRIVSSLQRFRSKFAPKVNQSIDLGNKAYNGHSTGGDKLHPLVARTVGEKPDNHHGHNDDAVDAFMDDYQYGVGGLSQYSIETTVYEGKYHDIHDHKLSDNDRNLNETRNKKCGPMYVSSKPNVEQKVASSTLRDTHTVPIELPGQSLKYAHNDLTKECVASSTMDTGRVPGELSGHCLKQSFDISNAYDMSLSARDIDRVPLERPGCSLKHTFDLTKEFGPYEMLQKQTDYNIDSIPNNHLIRCENDVTSDSFNLTQPYLPNNVSSPFNMNTNSSGMVYGDKWNSLDVHNLGKRSANTESSPEYLSKKQCLYIARPYYGPIDDVGQQISGANNCDSNNSVCNMNDCDNEPSGPDVEIVPDNVDCDNSICDKTFCDNTTGVNVRDFEKTIGEICEMETSNQQENHGYTVVEHTADEFDVMEAKHQSCDGYKIVEHTASELDATKVKHQENGGGDFLQCSEAEFDMTKAKHQGYCVGDLLEHSDIEFVATKAKGYENDCDNMLECTEVDYDLLKTKEHRNDGYSLLEHSGPDAMDDNDCRKDNLLEHSEGEFNVIAEKTKFVEKHATDDIDNLNTTQAFTPHLEHEIQDSDHMSDAEQSSYNTPKSLGFSPKVHNFDAFDSPVSTGFEIADIVNKDDEKSAEPNDSSNYFKSTGNVLIECEQSFTDKSPTEYIPPHSENMESESEGAGQLLVTTDAAGNSATANVYSPVSNTTDFLNVRCDSVSITQLMKSPTQSATQLDAAQVQNGNDLCSPLSGDKPGFSGEDLFMDTPASWRNDHLDLPTFNILVQDDVNKDKNSQCLNKDSLGASLSCVTSEPGKTEDQVIAEDIVNTCGECSVVNENSDVLWSDCSWDTSQVIAEQMMTSQVTAGQANAGHGDTVDAMEYSSNSLQVPGVVELCKEGIDVVDSKDDNKIAADVNDKECRHDSAGTDCCKDPSTSSDLDLWFENLDVITDRPSISNVLQTDKPSVVVKKLHACRFSKQSFKSVKVLGQVDKKFIACLVDTESDIVLETENKRMLILVDQHAAHERIRLEILTEEAFEDGSRSGKLTTYVVDQPQCLSFTEEEVRTILDFQDNYLKLGIDFERKSTTSLLIKAIPECLVYKEKNRIYWSTIQVLMREYLSVFMSTTATHGVLPQTIHKVLCSLACHGAIKFGDKLSGEECIKLINDLSLCDLPFQCAHGRPSVMPLFDMDRLKPLSYTKNQRKPNLQKLRKHMSA